MRRVGGIAERAIAALRASARADLADRLSAELGLAVGITASVLTLHALNGPRPAAWNTTRPAA